MSGCEHPAVDVEADHPGEYAPFRHVERNRGSQQRKERCEGVCSAGGEQHRTQRSSGTDDHIERHGAFDDRAAGVDPDSGTVGAARSPVTPCGRPRSRVVQVVVVDQAGVVGVLDPQHHVILVRVRDSGADRDRLCNEELAELRLGDRS